MLLFRAGRRVVRARAAGGARGGRDAGPRARAGHDRRAAGRVRRCAAPMCRCTRPDAALGLPDRHARRGGAHRCGAADRPIGIALEDVEDVITVDASRLHQPLGASRAGVVPASNDAAATWSALSMPTRWSTPVLHRVPENPNDDGDSSQQVVTFRVGEEHFAADIFAVERVLRSRRARAGAELAGLAGRRPRLRGACGPGDRPPPAVRPRRGGPARRRRPHHRVPRRRGLGGCARRRGARSGEHRWRTALAAAATLARPRSRIRARAACTATDA